MQEVQSAHAVKQNKISNKKCNYRVCSQENSVMKGRGLQQKKLDVNNPQCKGIL
jgi:hypothetical protein